MADKDETLFHLGLIAVFYVASSLIYSFYLHRSVDPIILENLKNIPKFIQGKGEIDIIIIITYVIMQTIPLIISAFLFWLVRDGVGAPKNIFDVGWYAAAIVWPFFIYFLFIDPKALDEVFGSGGSQTVGAGTLPPHGIGTGGEAFNSPGRLPSYHPNPPLNVALGVTFAISVIQFYVYHYKLPLTLTAILLGGYGGYRATNR